MHEWLTAFRTILCSLHYTSDEDWIICSTSGAFLCYRIQLDGLWSNYFMDLKNYHKHRFYITQRHFSGSREKALQILFSSRLSVCLFHTAQRSIQPKLMDVFVLSSLSISSLLSTHLSLQSSISILLTIPITWPSILPFIYPSILFLSSVLLMSCHCSLRRKKLAFAPQ